MRKILYIVLASATLLFAQVGIARNAHGIRVPSAYTLEQGFVYIGASMENISDGKSLALDGYTDASGTKTPVDNNAAAASWGMQMGYGVFDFLELGLSLPIYYESKVHGTDLDGMGVGDIQGSAKINVPLKLPIYLSFEGDIYAPTGTKSRGFRPRHAWFVEQEKPSYAYTSGNFTLAASGFISADFFGILLWNNFGGYLTPMGSGSNVFLWGSGLELFPKKMISLIAEVSGETRIHKLNHFENLFNEPARFTPGLRLHLPGRTELVFGADIGLDFLRGRNAGNGIEVIRKDGDNTIQYEVPSTHKTTFVFAITKTLDFSWKDTDHDGVADRLDMCPGSTFGVMVNNRGISSTTAPTPPSASRWISSVARSTKTKTAYRTIWTSAPERRLARRSTRTAVPATPTRTALTTTTTSAPKHRAKSRSTRADAPSTMTMTAS